MYLFRKQNYSIASAVMYLTECVNIEKIYDMKNLLGLVFRTKIGINIYK